MPAVRRFANGMRVRVTDPGDPFEGVTGTVVRRRMSDPGAWVNMDTWAPCEPRNFPEGDERANHLLLYPEQCEEVQCPA